MAAQTPEPTELPLFSGDAGAADDAAGAGAVEGEGLLWRSGRKRRRSRLRKRIARRLGYLQIRALVALVSRLPWPVGRWLGGVVGTGAYLLVRRERAIALGALTRVYGKERSPAELRALARAVFRHTAVSIIEWLILRRWPREKLLARFPGVAGSLREFSSDIRGTGSGVVAITAHFGNWEVSTLLFSHFAPGLLVPVAKRLYYEKYQTLIHTLRTSNGLDIIYTDESPRKMIRALQDGKLLAFLPDQDVRTNSGVYVEYFGLPAYTVTFPVDLALKQGVKLVFCAIIREGDGFRLIRRGPFDIPRTGQKDSDVLAGTQLWTRMLEEEVRLRPEQWAWLHPRWKTPPDRPRKQWDHKRKKPREE